jgi:hypothetical protein
MTISLSTAPMRGSVGQWVSQFAGIAGVFGMVTSELRGAYRDR